MATGWNQTNELLIGGTGQVYTQSTTSLVGAPTDTSALSSQWKGLGFLTEDGVSLAVTPNIQEFPVWQSRQPGRRETLATEILTSFSMAQWDEDTVPFAFGGGTASTTSYDFPTDGTALAENALVTDVNDTQGGTAVTFRFYWKRGNVTEATTVAFNRSNLAVLPVGFKALAPQSGGSPGTIYYNAGSFASGS